MAPRPWTAPGIRRALDRLFAAAPVQPHPTSPSNQIVDLDVRAVIRLDPYTRHLWRARCAVLANRPAAVPPSAFDFFTAYAAGVHSTSAITVDPAAVDVSAWEESVYRPLAVMYSGGSESELLAAQSSYADLLRLRNFYPHGRGNREFQCALVGMALGYGVTALGCHLDTNPTHPRDYEYSDQFIVNWNTAFDPYSLQYPLGLLPEKDDIYIWLLRNKIPFIACDTPRDGAPCGACWHCYEAHWLYRAAATVLPDVPPLPLDPDFATRARHCNARNLRVKDERFKLTTNLLLYLEKKYGFTDWH